MHKASDALGVSFDLPDSLIVDEMDAYQAALQAAVTRVNGNKSNGTITDARYYAIVYGVSVECGLITNWVCASMPDLSPSTAGKADGKIIYLVGKTISAYMRAITEIPPL